jgi:hypothetical protein
VHQFPNISTNA